MRRKGQDEAGRRGRTGRGEGRGRKGRGQREERTHPKTFELKILAPTPVMLMYEENLFLNIVAAVVVVKSFWRHCGRASQAVRQPVSESMSLYVRLSHSQLISQSVSQSIQLAVR